MNSDEAGRRMAAMRDAWPSIGQFMPPYRIEEPRMNFGERVLARVASALWWMGTAADRFGKWADDAGHAVRDRAVVRTNRVRTERIAAWYAANPQPPTIITTRPGVTMKRAEVVEGER